MGWMHFSSPGVEWEREFESEFPASLKDGGDGSANGSKWGLARWSDARSNFEPGAANGSGSKKARHA